MAKMDKAITYLNFDNIFRMGCFMSASFKMQIYNNLLPTPNIFTFLFYTCIALTSFPLCREISYEPDGMGAACFSTTKDTSL